MKKRSESNDSEKNLRTQIIGLGDQSGRKSYYPELQNKITQLENEIAERQSAEAGRAILSTVIESTTDMVSTSTVDGKVTYMNAAGAKLLGWSPDQIESKEIADAHPPWAIDKIRNEGIPTAERDGVWEGETAMLGPGGQEIPVSQVIIAHRSSSGEIEYYSTIVRDISERKKAEDVLQSIMEGTASASAETFFLTLVERLSSVLGVKYAMVAELAEGQKETARTLAVCADGAHVDNIEYDLHGSPCEDVVGKTLCYYPEDVAALFPEDRLLSEMGIHSFLGTPLFDSSGKPLGILAVMHDEKIPHPETAKRILSIFGFRVGAELERKQAEEERLDHLKHLESMDRIDEIIRKTVDSREMLDGVLQTMLSLFGCDRVWLLHPCNPDAESFVVPHEYTRPEYPGAGAGVSVPITHETSEAFKTMLASDEAVCHGPGSDNEIPTVSRQFGVLAQLTIAIYPKVGEPWILGMHQCSRERVWSDQEKRLFKDISRRLADALSTVLSYRNLVDSEERFRALVETSSDWIWEIDSNGTYTYCSPKIRDLLGYDPQEVLGKTPLDLMPRDEAERLRDTLLRHLQAQQPVVGMENRCLHKNGWEVILETSGVPINDAGGNVIGFRGIDRDITDRKRADEIIRNRLDSLTRPDSETADLTFTDLFDLDEIQKIQDAFAEATDVASIITDTAGQPITKPSNFCRLCRDVIRRTEKGLRNCMYSDAVIGRPNADGPVAQPCLSGGLWDGGTSITVGGKHVANWLIGQVRNDALNVSDMMEYAKEIGADPDEFQSALAEVPIMSTRQFKGICNALYLVANQLSQMAFHNILQARAMSERKRAEKALRDSEYKYRELVENANSIILRWDTEGRITFFNEYAQKFFGYTEDEVLGRHVIGTIVPESESTGRDLAPLMNDIVGNPQKYLYNVNENMLKTGQHVWIAWTNKAMFDDDGTLIGALSIGVDITDRKRAEEALRRSEEKYRVLFEQSADAILIIEDGRFVDCNDAAVAMLRYESKEQFLKTHPSELSPDMQSDGRSSFEKAEEMMRIARDTGSHHFEWEHKRADGEVFPVEVSLTMIPVEGRSILHTIWRDITDRKRAEESLLKSEAMLNTTLQAAPIGVGLVTDRILGWTNERISDMLGYTQDELNGMPALDLYETQEEYEKASRARHTDVENTGVGSVETRWVCKNGSVIDVLLSLAAIDADNWQQGLVFSVQDITERKRNEKLMRGRNAVLERLASSDSLAEVLSAIVENVEHVRPGVRCSAQIVDRETNSLRHGAAPSLPQFFNVALDGAGIGEGAASWGTAAHRRQRVVVEDVMHHPLWANCTDLAVRTGIRGSWSEPIVASNGEILGVFAMYFDQPTVENEPDMELLTTAANLAGIAMERRLTEEALRQREESYRTLVETMNEGFIGLDVEDRITYANQRACSMLEYDRDELVGLSVLVLLDEENADTFQTQLDMRTNDSHESFELTWISRSGRKVHTLVSPRDVRDEADEYSGLFAVITDITDLKELEDRVARSKKMELLGRLAGTVAHDLNNVLSGLVTYPDLLLMQVDRNSPLYQPLETIKESGERAAAIVEDLLTLARRGVTVREVVDLNTVVEDHLNSRVFKQLCAEHGGLQIETRLSEEAQRIMGSPVHLAQTVTNLVSNAAEAMPNGGKLSIVTHGQYVDRPISGYETIVEGEYAVLELTDTGTGIPDDDLKRIFEPFYTRKVMGRSGTGLGLTVVWGTVNDHDGYIEVESEQGRGTTFRLYFPATTAPEERAAEEDLKVRPMGTGQLFLVVDDAEHQRLIASEMLTTLGFKVATASSGEEAVEYVKTNEVEVILLDMAMGDGMDGLDTYREIVSLRPNQKAIIASGYAATGRVEEALRLGAGQYIKKPYSLQSMAQAIKQELYGK